MKNFLIRKKRTCLICLALLMIVCSAVGITVAKYITTIPVGTFDLTVEGGEPEVFAVYSADDNSLTFYNRAGKPTADATFNGKVATEVYTGFELFPPKTFERDMPWYAQRANITSVDFADEISPKYNTGYWFHEMTNLTTIKNMEKNLKTSDVTYMENMFYKCSSLTEIDVSHFDTSKVTAMGSMFYGCSNLTEIDLSSFNTSKNQFLSTMFSGCSNLETIYVSENFKYSASGKGLVFQGCVKLKGGNGSTIASEQESGVKVNQSISAIYACIDGKDGNKGYFTCVHAKDDSKFVNGICSVCGYNKSSGTYDLLEKEEISTINFSFDGIDDTNLEWKPLSEHEDMMPYPNEDYQIEFTANEGYKLPDTIKVEIDGTVYNVAVSGDNAEGEPTFANGILTIPAELLTDETKSLVITVSAVEIVEQKDEEKTDEEKADEEQTKDPSEEQNPTEETDDKKDDATEETTPKDEETETDKSDDTSNDNTTSGGEADKETDTDKPTEEIKQTFDIDITEIKNADIKGKDGKALSAENLLDEDGNAILVITADKDHTIPQSFNITICDTEYTIDTTKAEQEDGIVWDAETGTLTIPKDLVSGENVEIGVKLQAIIKEDDDEEADKKPEEDKNPDGDDSTEDTDDTTSGGTEGEKPKDETTEGGTDDTTQGGNENVGGNTDTENDETTENSGAENGGTENGEQKPSDDTAETPDEDTETDTPVVPPVTDGEQTGGTDGDDNTEEGGEENGGDNVPPVTEETPAQPPVTENDGTEENGGETGGEDTKPIIPSDKAETPSEDSSNEKPSEDNSSNDTSSGSTETGGNDDSSLGGTESGNDTPQGDTSASGNNNSTGESTDTSGSTTDNTPAAPPASESTNNSVAAPSTSTGTSTQGGESNSQGSGTTGGTSGGDGNSSSNTSASSTSATSTTTAKKKTDTTGSTGGDDSGDSN